MPRPSDDFEWATDATYDAPGKAWDGIDPKLEPPAGLKAEGWEPGVAPNARMFNWLLNLVGLWFTWVAELASYIGGDTGSSEWVYDAPRERTMFIGLDRVLLGRDPSTPFAPEWTTPSSFAPAVLPVVDDADAWMKIPVPAGATINTIQVLVRCSASRDGVTPGQNRWRVGLYRQEETDWSGDSVTPTWTQIGSTADDGGSATFRAIALITIGETVENSGANSNEGGDYYLWIRGPEGPAATDVLYGARVIYDEVGPRTY